MHLTHKIGIALAALAGLTAPAAQAAPPSYTFQNLGTLGGASSKGRAVNNTGQVAGESFLTGNSASHASLSDANGGALHDLGTLGGSQSNGIEVNNTGQVVGTSDIAGDAASHAFLSDANGGALHDLGTLGGNSSLGYAVNDAGQAVGTADLIGNIHHAFLFTGGQMLDMNSLLSNSTGGFVLSNATGISDTGFITGIGATASGQSEAFLLTPNAPVPEASSVVAFGLLLALGLGGLALSARRRKAQSAE